MSNQDGQFKPPYLPPKDNDYRPKVTIIKTEDDISEDFEFATDSSLTDYDELPIYVKLAKKQTPENKTRAR